MKHVIIGTGAAGIAAAKAIRGFSPSDEIVMVSSDETPYSRCMLHKYVSGERDLHGIGFVPENFFEEACVRHIGGVNVTKVDTSAKRVVYDGGETTYDRLLIATGANAAIPPIGQLRQAKNVFCLRHYRDARGIRELAKDAENVLVIGGGLVGLDAAYALLETGKSVTVVEMAGSILALNLDEHAAKAYQDRFEAAGCKFRLGAKAADTVLDSEGNVTRLMLGDGTHIDCDLAVVAAGVRPAVGFLEGSGIAVEHSIQVDCGMRTSVPDVYAAGDATGLSGIWPNAVKQGEVAAGNMCGRDVEYTDLFALKNTINFFSLVSMSLGRINPGPGDEVFVREDRKRYDRAIVRDNRVKGIVLQGDISNSGFWRYLIQNEIDISGLGKTVWDISFADFYSIDGSGNFKWAGCGELQEVGIGL